MDETDPDADKVNDRCPVPGVGFRTMLPGPYCKFMTAACSTAVHTMDGDTYRQLGINTETVVFQFRRKGSLTWDTRAAGCGPLVQQSMGELRACAEYEVRGRVLCNDGSVSGWTSLTDVSTAAPAAPALVLEEAKATSLILSVRPNKDCPAPEDQRYEVSYAKAGGPEKTLTGQIVPLAINGLARGTIYKVRIRVKDGFGESEWSAERELSTAK